MASMERFIGVGNPREYFESYEDVQEYFESLQKQCDKKKRFLDAKKDGKIDMVAAREKKAIRIKEYYQNPAHLKKYALDYMGKYVPSWAKLEKKIRQKCSTAEVADQVLVEIAPYFGDHDRSLAESHVKNMIASGKNVRHIRQKLYEKMFPKELINEIVSEYCENVSVLNEDRTRRKIEAWHRKGKDVWFIRRSLIERKEDKELVERLLSEVFKPNSER